MFRNKYKQYRNLIVTLTRKSKRNHYQKYFQENSNNIKKTWDGVKSIINISDKTSSSISSSLNHFLSHGHFQHIK